MKLYGLTAAQLHEVVRSVSKENYNGNLAVLFAKDIGKRKPIVSARFTVHDSHKEGAKINQQSGRHIKAACWHAHRDIMRECFLRFSAFRVVSANARFDSAEHFELTVNDHGNKRVGSMFYPYSAREACECGN